MAKIGIYCINKYRTGEYQADMICKALEATEHTTTRFIGEDVDFMVVINGVLKGDTMEYTNRILNKMKRTPNIFLVNEKRSEIPEQADKVFYQYKDKENYFQLSSVALFDERFDDVKANYVEENKRNTLIFWGHHKEGREKYEKLYLKNLPHYSLTIGDWASDSVPYIRDLKELHEVISNGRYTIIFGDDHDNFNNIPLRIYEALMCGVVPLFDFDFTDITPFTIQSLNDVKHIDKLVFNEFIDWFLPNGIEAHRAEVTQLLLLAITATDVENEDDTAELLTQRASIYGSYTDGIKARASMLSALKVLHKERHDIQMPAELQIMMGDLLLKIMRSVQDPSHLDSWADLEGYARLIKEYHNEL